MHIGVMIFATDYAMPAGELAAELEQRGFESLFVTEHTHIPASRETPWPGGTELPREYSHTYDPFVCLSFAAAKTKELKIGTSVCLLPQRDTIVTAKLVASLDRMSRGRFVFGIGGGWNREEMADHGISYRDRFRRMGEQVQAMKRLWTEEEAEFQGDFVNFSASWQHPKPLQKPHPPILLGGETDYTLKRVVDYCDGWMPRTRFGFDAAEGMNRLRRFAKEAGRDADSLSVSVFQAPPDEPVLDGYRSEGIDRAIIGLPSAGRETLLPLLDQHAALLKGA